MTKPKTKVLAIFGTRPEVIKLSPLIRELRNRSDKFEIRTCFTGQHRELALQSLADFKITPDLSLDVMSNAGSLGLLSARLFEELDRVLATEAPEWVLVQGDTTSAMVGAMSAFYWRIKVGHVEAGLRTGNRWAPFPEEVNRALIGEVAELHFAPTKGAVATLLKAGMDPACVHLTGNTVVDSLYWVRSLIDAEGAPFSYVDPDVRRFIEGKRLILVTSHRRESFGDGLEGVCRGLREVVDRYPDAVIVFPVHLNPAVQRVVHFELGNHQRIRLIEPVSYFVLVWLMQQSYCIFTDSGGIQEEAPSLGKPVLILRDVTERPEIVEIGGAKLVGTHPQRIFEGARALFEDRAAYKAMARVRHPFGDGKASERIADLLERHW